MRTITLELLRHGPAHNQLLSPLTPYMALCQNHGAITLHIPFEHNQLLFRLSALDYRGNDGARRFQLQDTARVIGDILAEIPGLTAESNKGCPKGESLTHLRLILSASELALLPFELALSPQGLPGSGQHLLLQPQMPICLTREVRRVSEQSFQWPPKPKVLFVAAAPQGTIPLDAHLQVLRQAIAPWIKYYPRTVTGKLRQEDLDRQHRERIAEHFHFLPLASIEAIERLCAAQEFSHVHILAHGIQKDDRFFLVLHKDRQPDEPDYVSGQRLATALRAVQGSPSGKLSSPAVVTLASCDSSNVGDVAGVGASIAHALHEAGIPLVVAGQFPLSFAGSVRIVETLYGELLWGADPRWLLYDLRRRLYSQFEATHDWASLTAYLSLPENFDVQLADMQVSRTRGCIDAAMNHVDAITSHVDAMRNEDDNLSEEATRCQRIFNSELANIRPQIERGKQRLHQLLALIPKGLCEIYGLLASTEKREAEILHRARNTKLDQCDSEICALFRSSRDNYWRAFEHNRANSWAAVQYLSLTLVSKKMRHSCPHDTLLEEELEVLWSMAELLSKNDLLREEIQMRVWAHSNLSELHLLSILMRGPSAKAEALALQHTRDLIRLDGDSFDVYAAYRQTKRYSDWFQKIAELDSIQELTGRLLALFPVGIESRGSDSVDA